MKSHSPSRYAFVTGLVLFLLPGVTAVASSGGGHGEITFMGDWLPRLVNFGIIAAVVVYFLRKPAADFFANRTADIARAMQESKEAREKAVAALVDLERKVREMEAEAARMVADAQERGEKDKQALIEEGRKVAQEIQVQVKQGIEIEVQKARTALAVEASVLSLELAESRIKDTISKQDHDRIVKDYVANVGGTA